MSGPFGGSVLTTGHRGTACAGVRPAEARGPKDPRPEDNRPPRGPQQPPPPDPRDPDAPPADGSALLCVCGLLLGVELSIPERLAHGNQVRAAERAIAALDSAMAAAKERDDAKAARAGAEPAHERSRPGDATTDTPVTPGGREAGVSTPGGPHDPAGVPQREDRSRETHPLGVPAAPPPLAVHLRPAAPVAPVRVRSHRASGRLGRLVPALLTGLAAAVLAAVVTLAAWSPGSWEPVVVPPAPTVATRTVTARGWS